MIIYSPTAISVVKAVLLGHLLGLPYSPKQEKEVVNLFAQEKIAADSYDLDDLIEEYVLKTGKELAWLGYPKIALFYARLNYALRHSSPNKYRIIELAVEDAIAYGLEFFFSNVSTNCRKFTDMAREVAHEVQRMLGFIRFTSPEDNILLATPKLFHDTSDLILKKFQARYPHYRIILVLGDGALSIEKGKLSKLSLPEISNYQENEDPYTQVWQEYYKSQYIKSRKNIPLASKAIPQKYWEWMVEGKILRAEKEAVDKHPPALFQQKFRP